MRDLVANSGILQRNWLQRNWQRIWVAVAVASIAIGSWLAGAGAALAGMGQPSPWQKGLQDPATDVASQINWLHDFVNILIIAITVFVLALMIYVVVRFNEKANPTPSKTTHHTGLEIAWTVIPIIILVVIAVPSFKLLYLQYAYPKPDLTIKATGSTWKWEHEFPDHDGVSVISNMIQDKDVLIGELGEAEYDKRYGALEKAGGLAYLKRVYADALPLYQKRGLVRQLSVDNEIAVPVNKVVHVLVTASDVIHNWTIPSFGSKVDAVPGRVTATWFKANKTGIFYGQCSELCGKDHSSMPIAIRVVSQDTFDQWVGALKSAKSDSRQRRQHLNRAREILRKAAIEDGNPSVRYAETGAADTGAAK